LCPKEPLSVSLTQVAWSDSHCPTGGMSRQAESPFLKGFGFEAESEGEIISQERGIMASGKAAANVQPVTDDGWETVVEPFGETAEFKEPGDTLIGTYKSSKQVETDDLNNPGEKRNQTLYELEDENGKLWSVW